MHARRRAERVARTPTAARAARGAALGLVLVAADWFVVVERGAVRTGAQALRAALLVAAVALLWAASAAAGAVGLRALRRRGWPW